MGISAAYFETTRPPGMRVSNKPWVALIGIGQHGEHAGRRGKTGGSDFRLNRGIAEVGLYKVDDTGMEPRAASKEEAARPVARVSHGRRLIA